MLLETGLAGPATATREATKASDLSHLSNPPADFALPLASPLLFLAHDPHHLAPVRHPMARRGATT